MNRVLFSILLLLGGMLSAAEVELTADRRNDILGPHSLTLPAPIRRWDCALPLGNGLTGGLLWGEGSTLNLSLDRGDLWDERSDNDYDPAKRTLATMIEAYKNQDRATWDKYLVNPNKTLKWTKIPGGRLVITLPGQTKSKSFHLDFEKATGKVTLSDGTKVDVFFSATKPIAMIHLPKGSSFKLMRPASINSLGYPAPQFSNSDNEVAYAQKTTESFNYAVAVQWKEVGDGTLAIISITNSNESKNPLALARERIADGFKAGWDTLYAAHLKWWKKLYNTSSVTIPLPRLQHHYNLVKYFYGAASRAHAKPMPLQGVWTADQKALPPWRGDYHNDLNTQMSYVAWQAAGLVESGMAYISFYWERLPQFRKYGKQFFGTDGAMVPGVMTLGGRAMGGGTGGACRVRRQRSTPPGRFRTRLSCSQWISPQWQHDQQSSRAADSAEESVFHAGRQLPLHGCYSGNVHAVIWRQAAYLPDGARLLEGGVFQGSACGGRIQGQRQSRRRQDPEGRN